MNETTPAIERYHDALATLPETGAGCHAAMLGVCNLGVGAGLPDGVIFADLRRSIKGKRKVPDSEITDAIAKARLECNKNRYIPPKARPRTTKRHLDKLLKIGYGDTRRTPANPEGRKRGEADIWEQSPIRIDWSPQDDPWRMIQALYLPDEMLFCGERYDEGVVGQTIRPAAEWIAYFQAGNPIPPLFMPNPLTGKEEKTKTGGSTYRADSCVQSFRFAVVEFDTLSRDDQIAFWLAIHLPVAALVDSGGKSIHGWIKVDSADAEAWEKDVERRLFMERLVPLGVDASCRNEARLSRTPGRRREETGRWQRLLYLAPEGRPVDE